MFRHYGSAARHSPAQALRGPAGAMGADSLAGCGARLALLIRSRDQRVLPAVLFPQMDRAPMPRVRRPAGDAPAAAWPCCGGLPAQSPVRGAVALWSMAGGAMGGAPVFRSEAARAVLDTPVCLDTARCGGAFWGVAQYSVRPINGGRLALSCELPKPAATFSSAGEF